MHLFISLLRAKQKELIEKEIIVYMLLNLLVYIITYRSNLNCSWHAAM